MAKLLQRWKTSSITVKLIVINVVVFLLTVIPVKIFILSGGTGPQAEINRVIANNFLGTYFYAQSDWLLQLKHLWTLLTYQFSHSMGSPFHIIMNMIILFFVGRMLERLIKPNHIVGIYLLGGVFGYLFFTIAANLGAMPLYVLDGRMTTGLVGASASVMAILMVVTLKIPTTKVHLFGVLPVPLWLITAVYILADITLIDQGNTGGHFAHIGGVVFGVIYTYVYFAFKMSNALSDAVVRVVQIPFKGVKRRTKMKVVYQKPARDDYQYQEQKGTGQDLIDEILDKINKYGYNSLSKKERDFLIEQSKKDK